MKNGSAVMLSSSFLSRLLALLGAILVLLSLPFASSYVCGEDDEDFIACVDDGPTWDTLRRQVMISLIIWASWMCASPFIEAKWQRACGAKLEGAPPVLVRRFVGSGEGRFPPEAPFMSLCLEWAQLCGSGFLIWAWIVKTYTRQPASHAFFAVEVVCVAVAALHRTFRCARSGFSTSSTVSLSSGLDCLTLPALLLQRAGRSWGGSWLTLAYLRAYHQWEAGTNIRRLRLVEHVLSELQQECVASLLETLLVVFGIAGTMWTLEALGDIKGFEDAFAQAGMGPISFFQMTYFTLVTISTVGYGDYSPSTVLSRAFSVAAIFAGVTFFSYLSVRVLSLLEMEASGRGKFRPDKSFDSGGRGHILLIGGGVTSGSATVLETFLRALCREGTPEIVLMSQTAQSKSVKHVLKQPWFAPHRIHFFVGSSLQHGDMERVRTSEASMVFILADFETQDTVGEDQRNLLIAANLARNFPTVQFRLMLCGIPALTVASQIGISEFNVFSIEALKAALMGVSLAVPGFSTLLLNLALPDLPDTKEGYEAGVPPGLQTSAWLQEYAEGCNIEIYGFLPSEKLVGMTFVAAALEILSYGSTLNQTQQTSIPHNDYSSSSSPSSSAPLLIAAHEDGGIVLSPSSLVITPTTVLWALARDSASCDHAAKGGSAAVATWIDTFCNNRAEGGFAATLRRKMAPTESTPREIAAVFGAALRAEVGDGTAVAPSLVAGTTDGGSGGNVDGDGGSAPSRHSSGRNVLMPPIFGPINDKLSTGSNAYTEAEIGTGAMTTAAASVAAREARDQSEAKVELDATQRAEVAMAAKQCAAVAASGGHTIVVIMPDPDNCDLRTIWEQLVLMVKTAGEVSHRPFVVVHNNGALSARRRFFEREDLIWDAPRESHERTGHVNEGGDAVDSREGAGTAASLRRKSNKPKIYYIVGDPMKTAVLHAAGIGTCRCLVTLAPSAPPSEVAPLGERLLASSPVALDEANLLLMLHLGQLIHTEKEKQRRAYEIAAANRSWVEAHDIPSASPSPEPDLLKNTLVDMYSPHALHFLSSASLSGADLVYASYEPRAHRNFAAGQVLPKPCIAGIFSMAYYTPGVLELLDGLMNPDKYDQIVHARCIQVPACYFRDSGSSRAPQQRLPSGYDSVEEDERHENMPSIPYFDVAVTVLRSGAIPLGIFRTRIESSTTEEELRRSEALPVVLTALPGDELHIRLGDQLYVLASPDWSIPGKPKDHVRGKATAKLPFHSHMATEAKKETSTKAFSRSTQVAPS